MTRRVTVFGIVQGVGYRPFVARLAEEMSLTGTIMNCGGIVQITVNTPSEKVFFGICPAPQGRFAPRIECA